MNVNKTFRWLHEKMLEYRKNKARKLEDLEKNRRIREKLERLQSKKRGLDRFRSD